MIHTKTVFVLGAGASMPYGLPSGDQLRADICRMARNPESYPISLSLAVQGVNNEQFKAFGAAFERSNISSIDSFLAKRPNFADIGKLVIAGVLSAYESPDELFSADKTDHWYKLLWNAMLLDAADPADVRRNAVRFVTFNYDRSLEYFLFESTRNTWGIDEAACTAILKNIGILHVYGQLGPFTHASCDGHRTYGEHLSKESLQLAARSLQIVPEARDDKAFQVARTWFDWAERICFLGFGFDSLNVDRLGLESVLLTKRERGGRGMPAIYATTLGRTDLESQADRLRLVGRDETWNTGALACSQFLRNSPLLLPTR